MDGRTDKPTDRRTNKASCRVACTRLKNTAEAAALFKSTSVHSGWCFVLASIRKTTPVIRLP